MSEDNNDAAKIFNFSEFMESQEVQNITNTDEYTLGYAIASAQIDRKVIRASNSNDETNAMLMALVDTVVRATTDNATNLDEQLKSHTLKQIAERISNGLSVTGNQIVKRARYNMRFLMKHDKIEAVNDPLDIIDNLILRIDEQLTQNDKMNFSMKKNREMHPSSENTEEGVMRIYQELQKSEARMSTAYPCDEGQIRQAVHNAHMSGQRELFIFSLGKFVALRSAQAANKFAQERGLNLEDTDELMSACVNFASEATSYKNVSWSDVMTDAAFHAEVHISQKQEAPPRVYNNNYRGANKPKGKPKKK
ncbi:hypothetical protein PCE1_000498 [Barthelona sp. PCE]